MTTSDTSSENQRLEAAVAWHVRLTEDAGERDWVAFTAWLEADSQNREAFNAVDAVSALVAEGVVSMADMPRGTATLIPWARTLVRHAWIPAGLVTGLAAALLLGVFLVQYFEPSKDQRLITAVGEHRDVELADGSTLHLNTDTAVAVFYGPGTRGARVEKGEALFEIAPDTARPFDVEVGDRRVHVVGTAFNILKYEGRITVTVKHGIVQVGPETGGVQAAMVRLQPGDQYLGREGSPAYQIVKTDPSNVAEWQNGRLLFDDAPLSQVAADLNRYFARPIVISDEATRNLRFSGILKIDDELTMLHRLAAFVPITVHAKEDQVILQRGSSD